MNIEEQEELLFNKVSIAKQLSEEIKLLKEEQKSILENDSELNQLKQEAEPLEKKIKEKEKAIKDGLDYKNKTLKIRDRNNDKKELESEISNLILEIFRTTGEKEVERNGELLKFKITGKI